MPVHKLTFHAPNRCSVNTKHGKFMTIPWNVEDVELAMSGGAIFRQGCHDFADDKARDLAFGKDTKKKSNKKGEINEKTQQK